MKKCAFLCVLTAVVLFANAGDVEVFAQCRAPRPLHVTNSSINPNASAFNGTVLIGTVESDSGEFPLEIVSLVGQDSNINNPLWNPPKYYGPNNSWTAGNLGNLFGLTIDGAGNIFAASAGSIFANGTRTGSLSGNHSGAIYKIDRSTGVATSFVNLTQDDVNLPSDNIKDGPGIGNLTASGAFIYATNFEDGKIYRIDGGGNVIDSYDHGVQGRPAVTGLEPIADTDAENSYYGQIPSGITLPGRRVWAVEVGGDRLYYSVWWKTGAGTAQPSWYKSPINIGNESQDNEVWSVRLNADGSFDATSVRREFSMSAVGGTGAQEPITDIIFTPAGKMILATRGMALDGGLNGNFHRGIVVELTGASGSSWTPNASKFRVGQNGNDASGGLAYDPTGNNNGGRIWATGEALFEGSFNNQQVNTFGFQGMNDNGTSQTNTTSVVVDSDGIQQQEKGSIGDVDIACSPVTAATVNISGRVLNGSRGISSATLTLLNARTSETKVVRSNSMGFFNFYDLPVGEVYIVTAFHKRFRFANETAVVQPLDNVTDLIFETTLNVKLSPNPKLNK